MIEYYKREYFISRIIAGYLRYEHEGKTLYIHAPTIKQEYEASQIYIDIYERAIGEEVYNDEEVLELLIRQNKWTTEDENNLEEVLPKHIEYWQIEMYKSVVSFHGEKVKKLRKYLEKAKEEQQRLHSIRHQYDIYTCHGTATTAKMQYIIERCTRTKKNKQYKWNSISIVDVVNYYNQNYLSPETIRYLSRTSPWTNIWSSAKSNGPIFGMFGAALSIEQQLLLMWSKMFDNIAESMESPSDDIIEDDDLLNGWMALQRIKREKEKKKQSAEAGMTQNDKIKNASEIFVMTDSQKGASDIYELNNPHQKHIVKQRLKKIEEKGVVKEYEFNDVQMDLRQQAVRNQTQAIKGR